MTGSTIGEVEESLAQVRAEAARTVAAARKEGRAIEAAARRESLEAGMRRLEELRSLRDALAADLASVQARTAALIEAAANTVGALAALRGGATTDPAPGDGLQGAIRRHLGDPA